MRKGLTISKIIPRQSDSYNLMPRTLVNGMVRISTEWNVPPEELETPKKHAQNRCSILFSQCRLPCSICEGDFGVKGPNHRIERALAVKALESRILTTMNCVSRATSAMVHAK
ncbi:hypothetical protein O9992_13265 [Vibrio lentus]|nr:hypothetical protein [Vibrio lentus]